MMCEHVHSLNDLNYKLCLVCLCDDNEAGLDKIVGETEMFFIQNLKVNLASLDTRWLCKKCYQYAKNAAVLARNVERACKLLHQLNQSETSHNEITEIILNARKKQEIMLPTSEFENPNNVVTNKSISNIEYVDMCDHISCPTRSIGNDSEVDEIDDASSSNETENSKKSSSDENDSDLESKSHLKVCEIIEKDYNATIDVIKMPRGMKVCRKKIDREKMERRFLLDAKFTSVYLSSEDQMKELEKKRMSQQYLESKLKCEPCGMPFQTKNAYERHMKRHDKNYGPHRCPICELYFVTAHVMKQHVLSHRRIYKCLICDQIVKRRSRISLHRERCGPNVEPVSCHICGKLCRDTYSLKLHLQSNHETGKGFQCHECKKEFVVKQKLVIHIRSHTGEKPFECPICGRCFSTNSNLRMHRLTHVPGQKSHCIECDRYFSTDKGLKRHLMYSVKHVKLDDYKYECKHCPGKFITQKRLQTHEKSHLKKHDKVTCDTCSKVLLGSANLQRHILAVHKVVDEKCEVCDKKFSLRSALANHMRSHKL